MADNSCLDAVLPTSWQLWDLILSHLHDAPISRMIVEGTHKGVSQSGGTYTNHDLYYAMDNPQRAKIAYVRLQDNLDYSILQNHILPPLDCLENQIEVLASLLIQRFEERGLCQIFLHHEPASLAIQHAAIDFVKSRCKSQGYNGDLDVAFERRPRLPRIVPLLDGMSQVPQYDDGVSLHVGWQTAWPVVKYPDEGSDHCRDKSSGSNWWSALDEAVLRAVNRDV
ncbi:hypothetical protein M436DRAFT_63477 [Aureobasidium namibiae CBS 147.97]|uniref:Uncharacterized protein n=1 Tax=Aureobasidium namibiae CBS 147.97 TaxID=1043004 RepID=A0A074WRF7_9PEZI|nr:uncharacterized protein M436DRAFT_63477 [Aureobasidium namibiae CBS 147.97]KEQ74154.1 hypothetical protein M436DRAFT_63477 [Aureobasidium namibiae CBS 147.97]